MAPSRSSRGAPVPVFSDVFSQKCCRFPCWDILWFRNVSWTSGYQHDHDQHPAWQEFRGCPLQQGCLVTPQQIFFPSGPGLMSPARIGPYVDLGMQQEAWAPRMTESWHKGTSRAGIRHFLQIRMLIEASTQI